MAEVEQVAGVEGEEVTQEPQESVEAKPSNELKVVIILKDSRVMLGVQSPDCDPVYTTLEGTLADALKRVPKLVDEAKQKWIDSPRNPKANLPAPEPGPSPARTPTTPKKPTGQPSFF